MSQDSDSKLSLLRPFNAYDFFGILVPGACFLISTYLFEVIFAHTRVSLDYHDLFFHWIAGEVNTGAGTAAQAGFFALGVIFVFVVGHVIAAISSFFIDRILIFKGYGYPFNFLLLKNDVTDRIEASRSFYRGSTFWLNLWIMYWVELRLTVIDQITWFHFILILLPFIVVGGTKIIVQQLFDEPLKAAFSGKIYSSLVQKKDIIKRILKYYAGPYNILAHSVENFIRTHERLPDNVVDKYHKYFLKKFKQEAEVSGSDNYWFSTFYVLQHNRRLYEVILQWYHISSFARNISTAFYLAYVYAVMALLCKTGPIESHGTLILVGSIAGLLGLACIMAIRFYHFYVSYYSKGLYRAFVYLNLLEKKNPPAPTKPKIPVT